MDALNRIKFLEDRAPVSEIGMALSAGRCQCTI